MRTEVMLAAIFLATPLLAANAEEMSPNHAMAGGHGHSTTFHMFRTEAAAGAGPHGPAYTLDVDGWIGGDTNKLWLKAEGTQGKSKLEDAEVWAMYSRNIATFWDGQVGLRHDEPDSRTYAVFGINGLAPYYFETEAHLFVSDKGKVSARVREENDFLLTQKLVVQPYGELNAYAQDVKEKNIGAGLADGKVGLQTRYEFTRKFAPYVDVCYGRKFGETSAMAKAGGEDINGFIGAIGLRLMF